MVEILDCVASHRTTQPALSFVKITVDKLLLHLDFAVSDCHQLLNTPEVPFICTPKPITCRFGGAKTRLLCLGCIFIRASSLFVWFIRGKKMQLKCISFLHYILLFSGSLLFFFPVFFFRNSPTADEAFIKEPQLPPVCPSLSVNS